MFRTIAYLAAAAILTTGAVAAMAEQPNGQDYKVTINEAGKYCIRTPAVTGSRLDRVECRTASEWKKEGVSFSRR